VTILTGAIETDGLIQKPVCHAGVRLKTGRKPYVTEIERPAGTPLQNNARRDTSLPPPRINPRRVSDSIEISR
jgi:hypothetical protein